MKHLFAPTLLLCACDVVIQIDATITVPVDLQQTLTTFPQELVVDFGENRIERAFIICDANGAQDIVVSRSSQRTGCAEETTVQSWISAFTPAPNEELLCGEQLESPSRAANLAPLPLDPVVQEVIFPGEPEDPRRCTSASAEVSLVFE